jgi:hypothetical protein
MGGENAAGLALNQSELRAEDDWATVLPFFFSRAAIIRRTQ